MVRVIYRFSVVPGSEAEFVRCWEENTDYIQRLAPGARGSVLLRGGGSQQEYVAVARWESKALWLANRSPDRSVVPALQMARFRALLEKDTSYEVFDELIDFLPSVTDVTPS